MKIAINGFGRIGRTFLRALCNDKDATTKISVSAINIGPAPLEQTAHIFRHDSVMGPFHGDVQQEGHTLIIDDHRIEILQEKDPTNLPWNKMDIDWVIEASGLFRTKESASQHIKAGARKVLITAPSKDCDATIIPGVNDLEYVADTHRIISLGSCTANCFAPVVKVIMDNFELMYGQMTTVHAYTNDQALLDGAHKDPRRARAAALNIIPTKTGADEVIMQIFPSLKGKIKGIAIRVPVPKVSLIDFSFVTKETTSKEELNSLFERVANSQMKGILEYSNSPLVSSDFSGNSASCIVDAKMTCVTKQMSKIIAWYDNEYGYSVRIKEFLLHTQGNLN